MSFEQKILGLKRLTIALAVGAFILGMLFMHIISMPPVWINEVCS